MQTWRGAKALRVTDVGFTTPRACVFCHGALDPGDEVYVLIRSEVMTEVPPDPTAVLGDPRYQVGFIHTSCQEDVAAGRRHPRARTFGCHQCGVEYVDPDALVTHVVETGHLVPPGLRQQLVDSPAAFKEFVDVLRGLQDGSLQGEPVSREEYELAQLQAQGLLDDEDDDDRDG